MCIAIPGQVVQLDDADPGTAWVNVCGVRRKVNITLLCDDEEERKKLPGQWVLVHAGFAMSLLDQQEAQKTLSVLQEMEEVEEDVSYFLTGVPRALH